MPTVKVPTLVVARSATARAQPEHGRYVAEHLLDARYIELPGDEQLLWLGDQDALLAEIQEFLTGTRPVVEPDRVLATVLFTDIVGSTERAARIGDKAWRGLLDRHHAVVRAAIGAYRGREVDTAGDGFLAVFDGPGRAVRCAKTAVQDVRSLDLEIRAGLHTGEIELAGDNVSGIAVHIGARVAALAGPSEVFVSSTVRDLVGGSGIEFEDRGEHELKGVPTPWRILAVTRV